MAATQSIHTCTHDHNDLLKFQLNIRMRKKVDLSEFEDCIFVGARHTGLCISKSTYLTIPICFMIY